MNEPILYSDMDARLKELRSFKYIYGYKYAKNPVNKNELQILRAANSQVFTESYYNQALQMAGKKAIDCSGLVCYVHGLKDIGSWTIQQLPSLYPSVWKDVGKPSLTKLQKYDILWKSGHVAIYLGDGTIEEARGINYGVQVNKFIDRNIFTKTIRRNNIILEEGYANTGWIKDSTGWWYAYSKTKGSYYRNTIVSIGGRLCAFNENGYLVTNCECIHDTDGYIIKVTGDIYHGNSTN